jgi:hypothetical protein
MRRLVAVMGVLLAVAGASGCGGGSSGNPEAFKASFSTLVRELDGWAFKTERLTNAVDQGRVSAFEFHAAPALLNGSELRTVSPRGVTVSLDASLSAILLDDAARATLQEIKNMYCYLFAWYQKEDRYPSSDELEGVFYEFLGSRFIPSTPTQKLKSAATLLAESIFEAHSIGEAAANTAIAAMCTLPVRR